MRFTVGSRLRAAPRITREPAHFDLDHEGVRYRVTLKRVHAARRFTLRVRAARADIVLTLPPHGSLRAAQAFAAAHAGWIAERVGRLEARIPFAPDGSVPLRGVAHRLVSRAGLRRRVWIEADAEQPRLCASVPSAGFGVAVEAFLRGEARRDLLAAVGRHAAAVNRTVTGLTLRDTKSRWGSCTARGALNFSWRLVLAPPPVLDYLAAHEVAHLVHMNHSPAFWALTRRLAPQIDEAERWLKQHGAGLHAYG